MSSADPSVTEPTVAVRFPLWLKLGLLFGALSALTTAIFGWMSTQGALEAGKAEQRERLMRWAHAAATAVDGDQVATFRQQSDALRPEYLATVERLRQLRAAAHVRWLGLYRRDGDRDSFVLDTESPPTPISYPSFDTWPALDSAYAGQPGYVEGHEDQYGRWDTAVAPIFARDGRVVAVAALDVDANWVDALLGQRLRDLLLQLLGVTAAVLFASALVARLLARHLLRLSQAARAVAAGDLSTTVRVATRDEVGELARSFNAMVKGLRERDVMRDAFGRYVTPEMARRVLADPQALRPGGELRTVTILMSDLRGFTSLSERLKPAEMVQFLNEYLGRMADLVAAHGGTVVEFIGDAVMALFGAPDAAADDALRALACAAAMQRDLERFNEEHTSRGLPPLEMGIGVHTGAVIVGNIGSERRLKYGVVGDDVNMAGRIESFTVGGEVLSSEATAHAAGPAAKWRGPIEVRAKGKSEPLKLLALVAIERAGEAPLRVPAEDRVEDVLAPVDLAVTLEPLEGKAVGGRRLTGRIVALSPTSADLVTAEALAPLSNVRLAIGEAGDGVADLYAKVASATAADAAHLVRLRFTSVPSPERLAKLIPPP